MSEFISPNLHPLLVHYPIGLVIAGTAIELFSFLGWRFHPIRAAARWMILLGVLSMVVSVTSGIYALHSIVGNGVTLDIADGSWHRLLRASPQVKDTAAWTLMVRHLQLESAAAGILLLVTVSWIAFSDRLRRKLHTVCAIGLIIGAGLMSVGAYFSGEGIYRHGVSVDTSSTRPAVQAIDYYLPPVEGHAISAGLAVALACLSIGLAIRARTVMAASEGIHGIAAALGGSSLEFDDERSAETAGPAMATSDELSQRVPSSRFALLTALVALLTVAGGWWVLASSSDASLFAFQDLWRLIRDPSQNGNFWLTRRMAHVICGSAIVVLPILLAIVSRFMPRSRVMLSMVISLLLLAIAAQIWLGVLLLNDGSDGPVTRFVPAAVSP